ncbi:MAG: hypothetical protein PHV93_03985 [Candidatus Pacebacteria bacterium]|nr:hypothetical protein [Candidatus Paceibacterota bacterium]
MPKRILTKDVHPRTVDVVRSMLLENVDTGLVPGAIPVAFGTDILMVKPEVTACRFKFDCRFRNVVCRLFGGVRRLQCVTLLTVWNRFTSLRLADRLSTAFKKGEVLTDLDLAKRFVALGVAIGKWCLKMPQGIARSSSIVHFVAKLKQVKIIVLSDAIATKRAREPRGVRGRFKPQTVLSPAV